MESTLTKTPQDSINSKEEEEEDEIFQNGTGIEIMKNLYLGNAKVGRNLDWLTSTGISRIFNLTKHHNNDLKKKYEEMNINLSRFWFSEEDLITFTKKFPSLIKEIETEIKNERKVLVHCLMGQTRSPLVVAASVMKQNCCTYEEAYQIVLSKRPNLKIAKTFIPYLKNFLNDNSSSNNKRSSRNVRVTSSRN